MPPVSFSWSYSPLVSALHAAELCSRRLNWVASPIKALVEPSAQAVASCVGQLVPKVDTFWEHVSALCLDEPDLRSATSQACHLAGMAAAEQPLEELVTAVRQLCDAFVAAVPDLEGQLRLRSRPLRELWEARGPGLISYLMQLLKLPSPAGAIRAAFVYPVHGGWGVAHPKYCSLRFEAVLTNPAARLPETVRLAWLVGQLLVSRCLPPSWLDQPGRRQLFPLALVPPVLQAATHVEWLETDRQLIQEAVSLWCAQPLTEQQADALWHWWTNYQDSSSFADAVCRLEAVWLQ